MSPSICLSIHVRYLLRCVAPQPVLMMARVSRSWRLAFRRRRHTLRLECYRVALMLQPAASTPAARRRSPAAPFTRVPAPVWPRLVAAATLLALARPPLATTHKFTPIHLRPRSIHLFIPTHEPICHRFSIYGAPAHLSPSTGRRLAIPSRRHPAVHPTRPFKAEASPPAVRLSLRLLLLRWWTICFAHRPALSCSRGPAHVLDGCPSADALRLCPPPTPSPFLTRGHPRTRSARLSCGRGHDRSAN